ncbi:hypothetical protein ACFL3D_02700 [Candidatus Omnitrophota bacterium]
MLDVVGAKNRFRALAHDIRETTNELQREIEQYMFIRRYERLKKLKKKLTFGL